MQNVARVAMACTLAATLAAGAVSLCGCSADGGVSTQEIADLATPASSAYARTEGAFAIPESIVESGFNSQNATWQGDFAIDASSANAGWVSAVGAGAARLKLQVVCDGQSYNYDLPTDGSAVVCPINMGNGAYTFRVMQNTQGNNYAQVMSVSADVELDSEFAPFLVPNVFCNFTDSSQSTALARQLAAECSTDDEVLTAVYDYVVDNIDYDHEKASALQNATGYIPSPDDTLAAGSGVCFDYSSLCAAMLRSVGIPCKIITGYVDDDIYHSWNMVYINHQWVEVKVSAQAKTWARVDATFAAGGYGENAASDATYTDRYVY